MRASGHIVVGPTDLSIAHPYGGTEIGKVNQCILQPQGTSFRVENEGLGEATDVLEPDNLWTFGCFLRTWDDDAIEKLFSSVSYSVGAVSGHAVYSVPGTRVPGKSALGRAIILLYVPDDLIHVDALLIYSGIAEWTEGAEIAFQRHAELGIPFTLDCLRDSNGNILRIGRFVDLSLT
jgi:hypothetical protein